MFSASIPSWFEIGLIVYVIVMVFAANWVKDIGRRDLQEEGGEVQEEE